jgi:hypothetical protein
MNAINRSLGTRTRLAVAALGLAITHLNPGEAQAQFTYTTDNGAITIRGYTGPGGVVSIPDKINGLPVTCISAAAFCFCTSLSSVTIPDSVTNIDGFTGIIVGAFYSCTSLTNVTIGNGVTSIGRDAFLRCASLNAIAVDPTNPSYSSVDGVLCNKDQTTLIWYPQGKGTTYAVPIGVTAIGDSAFYCCDSLMNVTIPNSVTSIGWGAFSYCSNLTGAYFEGNAPAVDPNAYSESTNTTMYYLPGTTGWGTTLGGRPTSPWVLPYPVFLTVSPGFGVQTNGFGFTISWATNASIVVEACSSLGSATWLPVSTNSLVNGSAYFSDPDWTAHPARFYRLR